MSNEPSETTEADLSLPRLPDLIINNGGGGPSPIWFGGPATPIFKKLPEMGLSRSEHGFVLTKVRAVAARARERSPNVFSEIQILEQKSHPVSPVRVI